MTPTDFADWQEAVLMLVGPNIAWLLAFALAGAVLLALVVVTAGILRRVRNWS